MNELTKEAQLHRQRNGRLNLDMFSRTYKPRWTLIKLNNAYYDRRGLAQWLKQRGSYVPTSRRRMTSNEVRNAENANPYRIYGKAPVLNKNRAASSR
jgi:hypothetical protein